MAVPDAIQFPKSKIKDVTPSAGRTADAHRRLLTRHRPGSRRSRGQASGHPRPRLPSLQRPSFHPRRTLLHLAHQVLAVRLGGQERLETIFDPSKPQQQWDVYVSAKFTGPAYLSAVPGGAQAGPHGKSKRLSATTRIEPTEPNGLWVARIILVSVVAD